MDNKKSESGGKENQRKELYLAIIWILAGLSLVAYGIIGFVNASILGVEELVAFLSSVEGKYIYLAAFVTIFIEGLYFIGSFFPGSTLVVILALLSQLAGIAVFIGTILTIFAGWIFAGIINILFAKVYRSKIARLQEDDKYQIKDRLWTTWFPAFRANYEVEQITDGGNSFKVFLSSLRVKFWASITAALCVLITQLFIDINEVSNEEGFVTIAVVALISFTVGAVKLRRYFK
jgi:hypothetical protein